MASPTEQSTLERIAAALNKILDPDLTHGRIITQMSPTPVVGVTISPTETGGPWVEGLASIGGAGLFREVKLEAVWKVGGKTQSIQGESWPLAAFATGTTPQMVAESLARLMSHSALLAVKHHQHTARAFGLLTSPQRPR